MAARFLPYNRILADTILERIASGELLTDVCKDADLPSLATFYKWLNLHPDLAEAYARAQEQRADVLADEIHRIADTPVVGEKVTEKADGKRETTYADMIEHRRLQIDARKWTASKLSRRYREASVVEHSGAISFSSADDADLLEKVRLLVTTGHLQLPAGAELVDEDAPAEEDTSDFA